MALSKCELERHRRYRAAWDEDMKIAVRKKRLEYYKKHREELLPKMRATAKARYAGDRRLSLYEGAKRRGKKEGVPFDITIDDIVIPEVCPVLGIPIEVGGPPNHSNLPSLDRFVPDKGYVKGNVSVISLRANSLKKNASTEEVRRLLEWMRLFTSQTPS